MFVPKALTNLFSINKDIVDSLRTEVAALRAANAILERELTATKLTSDWLRMQWNSMQYERTALIEKLYNIKLPAPEIVRQPDRAPLMENFDFEDVGNEMAKKLGLPIYEEVK